MDDKKNTTFDCDILICGTSLQNSLLAAYFSLNNYKVINIDKNKFYGDVNCSLNFNQFQDEKFQLKNFYEEYFPLSSSTNDSHVEKKKNLKQIIHSYFQINNNKFNIDLNPKILYNESNIVDLLVTLNAHTYISFVGIQYFYLTYHRVSYNPVVDQTDRQNVNVRRNAVKELDANKGGQPPITTHMQNMSSKNNHEDENDLIVLKIPLNKSQVFLDTNLSLVEKRMIMNFIYKNIIHDKNYTFSNFSNYNFVKKANVTEQGGKIQRSEPTINKNEQGAPNRCAPLADRKDGPQNGDIPQGKGESQKDPRGNHADYADHADHANIADYLQSYNISGKLTDYVMYGIGLFDLEMEHCNNGDISEYYLSGYTKAKRFIMNKMEFLQRLHILINSLNKFKQQNLFENAFIYPSYGQNDIIYAISRVACLNNSVYMINRKIDEVIFSPFCDYLEGSTKNDDVAPGTTSAKVDAVVLDNGHIIRPKFVISSGSNLNFYDMKKHLLCKKNSKKAKTMIKTNRLVVLSTYSLIGKNGLSFYIHKQPKLGKQQKGKINNLSNSVHILQLDYNSGSCPPGFFLTYFTYLEIVKEPVKLTDIPTNWKEKEANRDNPEKNKDSPTNQKPLNFCFLFDVLKLFVKKHKGSSSPPADSQLPVNIPFNESFHSALVDFFSICEAQEGSHSGKTDKREFPNEENEKIEDQTGGLPLRGNTPNGEHELNGYPDEQAPGDQTGEATHSQEQPKRDNAEKESFVKTFNNLLTKEGVIYCAYYEYEPTVYRKDTVKMVNQNAEHYRKIFESIEERIKEERADVRQKGENELDRTNPPESDRCSTVDNRNNISNGDPTGNKINQVEENKHEHKNTCTPPLTCKRIELDENKHICNLLFTNDTHNYPIYPLIEDVSTFFYIINKIHRTFISPNTSQTIYDTFGDKIRTMFSEHTAGT
ncbi:GDP dissociation inhibitor, putative [Plasmodium vivax]|uniref:GDP dissociation inhibitor, putative n=1 Tax=Plasmodium vivax TaxID=5855 RepID=A0A564ZRV2_PLAVI|nr:GDP dissociation inhibitor, putative [Plasmodium vivax]